MPNEKRYCVQLADYQDVHGRYPLNPCIQKIVRVYADSPEQAKTLAKAQCPALYPVNAYLAEEDL